MFTFFFVFFVLIGIVLALSYMNVGEKQVAVLEWRTWIPGILKPADPSHVIARDGEQGIEARHYVTGIHWILLHRLFARMHSFPIVELAEDECLTITATDGEPLPPGQVFGAYLRLFYLSDGAGFLRNRGCKGSQDWVVGPGGTWAFNPFLFKHKILKRTEFLPTTIKDPSDPTKEVSVPTFGLVTALTGEEIPETTGQRLLGQRVKGHNNFQHVHAFLEGTEDDPATGKRIRGQRGPQRDVVEAAAFLHPLAFKHEVQKATLIPPGFVGVRVSNVGENPNPDKDFIKESDGLFVTVTGSMREYVQILSTASADTRRGYRPDTYKPGTYLVSPWVERVVLVDVTPIKVCFHENSAPKPLYPEARRSPIRRVRTKDAFEITLLLEVVIQINPKLAPMLVAHAADVNQSIRDWVAPVTERIARETSTGLEVEVFIAEQGEVGKEITKRLQSELDNHFIGLASVNIVEIQFLDKSVLERVRATTDLKTLTARVPVETKRKEVETLAGQADAARQAEVIKGTATARKEAREELGGAMGTIGAILADPESLSTVIHGNGKKKKKVTTVEETEE